MPPLTKEQRRELARTAQSLKAEVIVGKDGLTAGLVEGLEKSFNTKELVKVKLLESCPQTREDVAAALGTLPGTEVVNQIGRTVVVWRELKGAKAKPAKKAAPAKKSLAKKALPQKTQKVEKIVRRGAGRDKAKKR